MPHKTLYAIRHAMVAIGQKRPFAGKRPRRSCRAAARSASLSLAPSGGGGGNAKRRPRPASYAVV